MNERSENNFSVDNMEDDILPFQLTDQSISELSVKTKNGSTIAIEKSRLGAKDTFENISQKMKEAVRLVDGIIRVSPAEQSMVYADAIDCQRKYAGDGQPDISYAKSQMKAWGLHLRDEDLFFKPEMQQILDSVKGEMLVDLGAGYDYLYLLASALHAKAYIGVDNPATPQPKKFMATSSVDEELSLDSAMCEVLDISDEKKGKLMETIYRPLQIDVHDDNLDFLWRLETASTNVAMFGVDDKIRKGFSEHEGKLYNKYVSSMGEEIVRVLKFDGIFIFSTGFVGENAVSDYIKDKYGKNEHEMDSKKFKLEFSDNGNCIKKIKVS